MTAGLGLRVLLDVNRVTPTTRPVRRYLGPSPTTIDLIVMRATEGRSLAGQQTAGIILPGRVRADCGVRVMTELEYTCRAAVRRHATIRRRRRRCDHDLQNVIIRHCADHEHNNLNYGTRVTVSQSSRIVRGTLDSSAAI